MESFISKYPNVFNEEQCQVFINAFESCSTNGKTIQSHSHYGHDKTNRQDEVIMFDDHCPTLASKMNEALRPCIQNYVDVWPGARGIKAVSTAIKVQKTIPRGGYHLFHCEASDWMYMTRQFVWLMYLNDSFDAGETEFLNQEIRLKPEKGMVVIWPASWPWQHRGNPPMNGVKYIATGWWHLYPSSSNL